MRVTAEMLVKSNTFMYYRTVMRWASINHNIGVQRIELLFSLMAKKYFSSTEFSQCMYLQSWRNPLFREMINDGWIVMYRQGDYKTGRRSKDLYKLTLKAKTLIKDIFKMLTGEKDIPVNRKSKTIKGKRYRDKVLNKAVSDMLKDKNRKQYAKD